MSILACLKSLDHFQIDKSTSRQHSKCLVMLAKRVFPGKKSKIPNISSEFALKSQVDDGDLDLLSMSIIALSSSIGLGWNRTDVWGKSRWPMDLLSCNLRENSFSRIHEFSVTCTMCLVRVESCVRRLRKQSDGIKSFDLNMASSRAVRRKQKLFRGRHLMELVGNVVLVCSYRASVQTRPRDFE